MVCGLKSVGWRLAGFSKGGVWGWGPPSAHGIPGHYLFAGERFTTSPMMAAAVARRGHMSLDSVVRAIGRTGEEVTIIDRDGQTCWR
jgi:hypothetical protein